MATQQTAHGTARTADYPDHGSYAGQRTRMYYEVHGSSGRPLVAAAREASSPSA